VQAFPTIGLYHASKWALEGFSQSLAAEVAGLGIRVTIVEPTGYSTDWSGPSAVQADHIAAYEPVREALFARFAAVRNRRGDPQATGPAILELVDTEQPPLRVFFGDGPLGVIREEYARRITTWEQWAEFSVRAHGNND
jgi:NAD(P)-dependent dehydrogenase (short-subunit alcohol dehydrogenase family)